MSVFTPEPVAANRPIPHLRSEISRLLHRRLYVVLTAILLAGITLVSVIAFFQHSKSAEVPPEIQAMYEQEVANFERSFDDFVEGYEQCLKGAPDGEDPEAYCGLPPDMERDRPQLEWFYNDRRYSAADNLPLAVIATTLAAAMLAFVLGASSGGAEWSSRSMTLQLLWEPRRFRLLTLKWLGLAVITALTTAFAMAWALVLAALTANARGTWDGVSDGLPAPATGEIVGSFWPELLLTAGRGVLLVVVAASFGFAIAMLVRNTGASLGVAFVYFAVGELAQQLVFLRFGIMEWMLSSNASAFLIPGGIEVVSGTETVREGGGSYEAQSYSHLSNLRGFSTLLLYLAAVAVPASWSFTRRDVS